MIPGQAQVVRHRWNLGKILRPVVVGANARRQHTGQHRKTGRGTQRKIAVRIFEHHAFIGEAIQVGRICDPPIGLENLGFELVSLDQQNIRFVLDHRLCLKSYCFLSEAKRQRLEIVLSRISGCGHTLGVA